MSLNIAILASGSGTNAANIIALAQAGKLDVQVRTLISNRPNAPVLARAKAANIPCHGLDHEKYPSREAFDRELLTILDSYNCQLLALAGYMRLLSSHFLQIWQNRVINIHPAILPAFPGTHGIENAFSWGAKITGVTVHFVEEKMDSGPPIIQAAVPILADDSLESLQKRIHAMEYLLYPQALQWLAENRVRRDGRKVRIVNPAPEGPMPCNGALVWPPLESGFQGGI